MATENILLKFSADLSGIKSASEELVKMGKLTEDDKKKFDTMIGTIEGIDDALKEAGVEMGKFSKAVGSSADSGKSLRTQMTEARNEAVRLSQAFGPFSKEAREAAKRAAALKDELGDMNDVLDALNPDAKLNAFVKLGQGVQGAFQAATGALQVFGVENERITKLAQQFQGVLNITQGINSVLQLKDVYTQLRLVLGITTTAQTGLAAATAAGAVATEGATAATVGFSAALTATGIGAIVVALGALVLAWVAVEKSISDAQFEAEQFDKRMADINAASKTFGDTFNKLLDERVEKLDFEIKKAEARGATEKEILQLTVQRAKIEDAALDKAISLGKATQEQEDELIKRRKKNGDELELLLIKLDRILATEKEINRVKAEQAKAVPTEINPLPSPKVIEQNTREMMEVIGTTITKLSTDLPQLPFFSEAERQQKREDLANLFTDIYGAYSDLSSSIMDLNNQMYENDFNNLKQSKEDGFLTEKQYQDKVKALRIKQFEENKKFQIAQAIMGTAQGVINALAVTPPNAVPAAIALATALGTLNLFKILSAEAPSFKKGTLNFQGGNLDSEGGRMAILHPNEAVIPAQQNRDYHPTIKALFNKQIKASEINSFVEARLSGRIQNSIDAKIDHRKLGKLIKGNNHVELTNAKIVGKIIANELTKSIDIRRN